MDDNGDILGNLPLRTPRTGPLAGLISSWNSFSGFAKFSVVFGFLLSLGILAVTLREKFKRWQERSYKKSMRRRHGISDDDHRPFNVAYAAVCARQERSPKSQHSDRRQRNALAELTQQHQRLNDSAVQQRNVVAPWSTTSARHQPSASSNVNTHRNRFTNTHDPLNFEDRYNPNTPTVRITEASPQPELYPPLPPPEPSTHRRVSRKTLNLTSSDHTRKRSLDVDADDSDVEHNKKTRVEGEEYIDGDEDAGWSGPVNERKRGSKREVEDDGEEEIRVNGRDKRVRKVSRDYSLEDEDMEYADEVMELDEAPGVRGKKRDRAEAGSTFGGDDDDSIGRGKSSRRQKRRTVSKRKSDVHSRGKKRERDMDEDDSDSEGNSSHGKIRTTRKKRGKQAPSTDEDEDDSEGNVSMEDAGISNDPLCKGRRIGEEWELNGVLYKVGLNGQRLQQALVKKARSKFNMPQDSQHPDRQANFEVFIETWLTEEQHDAAKERHELAWQDSTSPSAEPETPGNVPDLSPVKGKNLLWSSTSTAHSAPASPVRKGNMFRQSVATNVGLRINPFHTAVTVPGRRIASAHTNLDSPSSTGKKTFKTFSKWEKQDLEAEAMARIRTKMLEQKKQAEQAALSPTTSVPALTFGKPAETKKEEKPSSVPSITLTPPTNKPATASVTFGFPATGSTSQTLASGTSADKLKPAASTFAWPASTPVTSAPANEQPKTVTATNATPPSLFSFGTPTAQPSQPAPSVATPNLPSTSTVPNFFLKPGSTPAAQPQAPTETAAPKPSFSLNVPSTSSNAAPAITLAPAFFSQGAKSSTSVFGNATQSKPEKEERSTVPATATSTTSLFGPPSGGSSPFSFGKPMETKAAASGAASATSASNTTAAPGATTGTSGPKFDFGVINKAQATTFAASASPAPTTDGAAKPATASSSFSFNAQKAPPTASTPITPSTTSVPLKFSFAPPSGSAFGAGSATSAGSNANASSSTPAPAPGTPNVFAFPSSSGNAFSTTPAGSPSAFGSSQSTSTFGNNAGSSSKPATELPKSVFGSATPAATPTAENKATFSFKFGEQTSTQTDAKPTTSIFGGTSMGQQSVFGKPTASGLAAFGFGAPSSSTASAFTFGSPNAGQKQQQ